VAKMMRSASPGWIKKNNTIIFIAMSMNMMAVHIAILIHIPIVMMGAMNIITMMKMNMETITTTIMNTKKRSSWNRIYYKKTNYWQKGTVVILRVATLWPSTW
jgi:hypothetical protein